MFNKLFKKKDASENLTKKIKDFVREITEDKRWDINNQVMFDTFSLTLSGYACGVGRHFWFLNDDEISNSLNKELINLGAGEKYVKSLVDFALSTFEVETNNYQSELVGIGYFKFSDTNFKELKESIFENTRKIEEQLNSKTTYNSNGN